MGKSLFSLITYHLLPITALPFIMSESLVGLRHAVRVFFLLDRIAAIVRRIKKLSGEAVNHGLFTTTARVLDNPADGQRAPALLMNFNRHLIGRTANAPRFNFDRRPHVFNRFLENLERLVPGLFPDLGQGTVK